MALQRNSEGHITADSHGRAKERAKIFKDGAGKGGAYRPVDQELYELGLLISNGDTEEIREAARLKWYELRGVTPPD